MLATNSLANSSSVTADLSIDANLGLVLEKSLSLSRDRLQKFASNAEFRPQLAAAFGEGANLDSLQSDWLAGDFSILVGMTILPSAELGGAKGAYSADTDRIYLSQEFIQANQDNPEVLAGVLLEEAGHRIDARFNPQDSAGDEGKIFSRIVRTILTSDTQLQQLHAEYRGIVTIPDGWQIGVEQAGTYTGTNLKTELKKDIPALLDKVKNYINTEVLQGLPILGNQLGISTPLETLFNGFKNQIITKLDTLPNVDPVAEAKQALLDVLHGALDLLQDSNGDNVINLADIDAIEGADSVSFKLKLGKSVKTSVNLDEKIGLPALGLQLKGGVTPELAFDWNLEFGVNKTNGFFVKTDGATPELSLKLKTQLVDALGAPLALKGMLGFLELDAKDLADPVFGTLNDILEPIRPVLKVLTDRLPVVADLVDSLGDIGKIAFDKDPAGNPDGVISSLDLALLNDPKSDFVGFVRAIKKIDTLTQSITKLSNSGKVPITVGSFNLADLDARKQGGADGFDLSKVNLDLGKFGAVTKTANEILDAIDESGPLEVNGQTVKDFTDIIRIAAGGTGGKVNTEPQFPILTDPKQVFKLLLGQDAEFFKCTLPELRFNVGIDEFFGLGIGVQIKGKLDTRIQLAVGYDSYGIKQFVKDKDDAKDPSKIFNGFYIDNAIDPNGSAGRKTGAEVTVELGAAAALSLFVASTGFGGGI